jgi:SAM-dependent methyltransferase
MHIQKSADDPFMRESGQETLEGALTGWNVSALDEVKAEFLKAGGDARFFAQYRNEALFGLSCIQDQLAQGMTCLEVGAGPGLLSLLLAHNGLTVDAMEPLGQGFESFGGLLGIVQGRRTAGLNIIRSDIEEFQAESAYNFIFSINVFEHVDDWRLGLRNVHRALKTDGKAYILCPNYNFPYEPHFSIPLLLSKRLSFKIFNRKITIHEREQNAEGLWRSLNFITYTEVKSYCKDNDINIDFDKRIMALMLKRLTYDSEFARRHPSFVWPVSVALRLKLDEVVKLLPLRLQPYLFIIIRR